jgi:peptidoglycan/LPS O-acetylase OafA/YrhL
MTQPKPVYYPELDGVRGVAALSVVLYHYTQTFFKNSSSVVSRPLYQVLHYGVYGVDLFFVLSGFLITGILLRAREGERYFTNFYMRRALRIFPLYFGVLGLYFVILPTLGLSIAGPETTHSQFWLWTYLSNFPYSSVQFGDLTHFWTLSVEEHFYLLWPLVVFFLSTRNLTFLVYALIGSSIALRWFLLTQGLNPVYVDRLTPCRFDSLVAGALLAVLAYEGGLQKWIGIFPKALLGLSIPVIAALAWQETLTFQIFGNTLIAAYFAIAIGACALGRSTFLKSACNFLFLKTLGKYSYGIYVLHLLAQRISAAIAMKFFPSFNADMEGFPVQFVWVLWQMSIAFGMAWLSFNLYESRFLKLKTYF